MVTLDENYINPIIKPIELKNIGHLQKIPTHIECPACEMEGMSIVRLEAVTCWQKFLNATNLCKTAESRYDINHYCSSCGCYIGRYIAIGCYEGYLSKRALKKAASDSMTIRKEPGNYAKNLQESRERVLANMAKDKAEREQKKEEETKDGEKDKENANK